MHSITKDTTDIMVENTPLRHMALLADIKRLLAALNPVNKPRIIRVEISTYKNSTTFTRCSQ